MGKSKIYSKIIYSESPLQDFISEIKPYDTRKIFFVTEDNVLQLWGSRFLKSADDYIVSSITIPSGEENKKIESVAKIWKFLSDNGADRRSLLINMGGGMLTDLAGFAASAFKRGIDFLNIPTTLLSQVDASVGGKTGINFNGLKNEIGTFKEPIAVIIHSGYLQTLDRENVLSGFAEMVKHGLIHSPAHLEELTHFDIKDIDYSKLQDIIRHSVEVKEYFVKNDPTEMNIRKALNFGHTAGHAIESLAMEQKRPVLHGFAVAWGMIAELYLSVKKCGYPMSKYTGISQWLFHLYGKFELNGTDFNRLYELMMHDKKNESGRINFTLLSDVGKTEINQNCDKQLIFEALKSFRNFEQ
jgi:3-dehydroquinate synthase